MVQRRQGLGADPWAGALGERRLAGLDAIMDKSGGLLSVVNQAVPLARAPGV